MASIESEIAQSVNLIVAHVKETITNNLIGATKEPWFELKGTDLIKIIRKKRKEIPHMVVETFRENTFSD